MKSRFSINIYGLIFSIMIIMSVLTYILPAGQYDTVEKDGRTYTVAGSYHRVEANPQGIRAFTLYNGSCRRMSRLPYLESQSGEVLHGRYRLDVPRSGSYRHRTCSSKASAAFPRGTCVYHRGAVRCDSGIILQIHKEKDRRGQAYLQDDADSSPL